MATVFRTQKHHLAKTLVMESREPYGKQEPERRAHTRAHAHTRAARWRAVVARAGGRWVGLVGWGIRARVCGRGIDTAPQSAGSSSGTRTARSGGARK